MKRSAFHTAWRAACLGLLAFLLVLRALRYLPPSSAPGLDRLFGEIMVFEVMSFMLPWGFTTYFLIPLLAAALVGACLLRKSLARKEAGVWRLTPISLSIVCGFMVYAHYLFDMNPFVASFCGVSLLLPRPRKGASRLLAAAWVVWFAAGAWAARDFADRAAIGAWALVLFGAAPLAARRVGALEARLALALSIIPMNLFAATLPLALPLHGGTLLGRGLGYDFCESPKHGRLLATVPDCPALSSLFWTGSSCRKGRVVAYDAASLERLAAYDFFSEDYYGRLEQIICLEDEAVIAVPGSAYRSGSGQTALSFRIGAPEKFTPLVAGPGFAAALAYDARHDAVFYAGEDERRLIRQDRRTGRLNAAAGENLRRRWGDPAGGANFPDLAMRNHSVDGAHDRLYLTEWTQGRYAYALDLATLEPVARYDMRNGASLGATVDVERARLYIPGLWGLEVFDLATGKLVLRKRLGFVNRTPILDARRNRIYVTSTVDGKIRVLDRDTLEVVDQIPVGYGTRQPELSLDGGRLYGSSIRAHYYWTLPRPGVR